MQNDFLTVRQASQYLGVKPSSLYAMVERKEIPHYRVRRLIKFTKADLDAYLQKHKIDCIDIDRATNRILKHACNPKIDIHALAKKKIAEVKENMYTSSCGTIRSSRVPRKEVSYERTL